MSQDTEVKTVQTNGEDIPKLTTGVYGKRYVGAKELVTLFVTGEINKFNLEGYLSYFMLKRFWS